MAPSRSLTRYVCSAYQVFVRRSNPNVHYPNPSLPISAVLPAGGRVQKAVTSAVPTSSHSTAFPTTNSPRFTIPISALLTSNILSSTIPTSAILPDGGRGHQCQFNESHHSADPNAQASLFSCPLEVSPRSYLTVAIGEATDPLMTFMDTCKAFH